MAKLEIELQPEEQSRLEKQAEAAGLGLKEYILNRLRADEKPVSAKEFLDAHRPNPNAKPLSQLAAEFAEGISEEEWAKLPPDASVRYKEYLYGPHEDKE